jgi:hypothetical protein
VVPAVVVFPSVVVAMVVMVAVLSGMAVMVAVMILHCSRRGGGCKQHNGYEAGR